MKKAIYIFIYFASMNLICGQIDSVNIKLESELEFPSVFFQLKSSIASRIDNRNNDFLYSANLTYGLGIYSIANPDTIELVVDIETSTFDNLSVSTLQQVENYLYVGLGDFQKINSASGIAILDIVDPTNPVLVDMWVSEEFINGVSHIDIYDNVAYLSMMNDGLLILDVEEKDDIKFVSSMVPDLSFPTPSDGHHQGRGMTKLGDILYYTFDRGGFRAIDVSDIENPTETQMYINQDLISASPAAYNDVVIIDHFAYVTVDYCGLEILDISTTPWSLIEWYNPVGCSGLNWFGAELHANEMVTACNDSLLFMSAGNSEVIVFDTSNPAAPKRIGGFFELDNELAAYGLHVFEDRISVSYINNPINIPFVGNWGGLKMLTFSKLISTSSIDPKEDNSIALFPNPAHSVLHFDNYKNLKKVEIYSAQGVFIKQIEISDLTSGSIDISTLKNGTYLMRILSDHSIDVQKFVKL